MRLAEEISTQENRAFIGLEHPADDIERICQVCSEKEIPPKVFLLSSVSSNSLLVVRVEFLEDGQLITCPGLPLVGAVFGPDWGYARAELSIRSDGTAEFREPSGHPDTFMNGDTWGYRLCPIDNQEIPQSLAQLACIRAQLAKPTRRPERDGCFVEVRLTEL
jgi:hypothetical protein